MSKTISTKGMSKKEWLSHRMIGGSDAAAILGLNSFSTPLDVYNRIIDPDGHIVEETPRMKAGKMLEPVIADYYVQENKWALLTIDKIFIHDEYDFLRGNIDRKIYKENDPGVLECKNTNSFYQRTWEDKIPLSFYVQLQFYLAVTGWKWGAVAILIDGWDFQYYEFDRNDNFIDDMIGQLCEFWNNKVLKKVPPPPINEDDIKTLYPVADPGKTIQASSITMEKCTNLKAIKARIKDLTVQKKEHELQIKIAMADNECLEYGETVLATFKNNKPSMKFDAKAFKLADPDSHDSYLVEAKPQRRFLLK